MQLMPETAKRDMGIMREELAQRSNKQGLLKRDAARGRQDDQDFFNSYFFLMLKSTIVRDHFTDSKYNFFKYNMVLK
ncbi:hypothetical protein CDL12_12245 [Handroanthus impetiginosus]|uniref:Uncharacterized protein n=1 Tax=Handroanthus impetiginosus TaxID=429701 RepID=A0A2G9HCU8_9LAMI|nr:hypothetical protein CDL12_12245 [Handroanthus impetiginosus]